MFLRNIKKRKIDKELTESETLYAIRELRWTRIGLLLCSILLAVLLTYIVSWQTGVIAEAKMQQHLSGEVLRFHVLANSDSKEDQNLKMQVKEQILTYLEKEMPKETEIDQTIEWMRKNTDALKEVAQEQILKEGYDYPVSAAVTTCYFPEKTYGDVTFPAGNYEALRIEIGAAKGHNWWCVLYPNLCFLDAANAVVPEEGKEKLQSVLTEEEYAQVTATSEFEIKWYFLERIKSHD